MSAAPTSESPAGSPSKMSRTKAADGAAKAVAASQSANKLLFRTQAAISARALHDSALPCTAVSPSGVEQEENKQANAVTTAESPWYQGQRKATPTQLGLVADGSFQKTASQQLRGLSLNKAPLSFELAQELSQILGVAGCQLHYVDLAHSLDPQTAPALDDATVTTVKDSLAEQFGPESSEDAVAAITAALEKFKQEYTEYEPALDFLAKKQLDRYAMLFAALDKNGSVRELDLSFNNLGGTNAEGKSEFALVRKIGKVIDGNNTLARVNFRGNPLGPIGCGLLAKAMCKNIAIHTLDLGGCDIMGEPNDEEDDNDQEEEDPVFGELYQGLEGISEVFKKNKFLRCLALRNNRIKGEIEVDGEDDGLDTSLGKLLEPLKKFHRLQILDLGANELGAGGCRMLFQCLAPNKSLKVLDISDNDIGPQGLKQIAQLMKASKSIDTLVLQQNGLAGTGKTKKARREALEAATDFGAALGESKLIKSLNLTSNHFGPELSAAILAGLAASRVEELYFGMNDLCGAHSGEFSDVALSLLINAACGCPLKKLNLSGNFLGATGLDLLVNGVPVSTEEAEMLNKAQEEMTEGSLPPDSDEAKAEKVAATVESVRGPSIIGQLDTLDVSRNNFGDSGVVPLLNHLASNDANLYSLDLSYNGLSDAKTLGSAIAANETVRNINLSYNTLGDAPLEDFKSFADALVDRPSVADLDLTHNLLPDTHGAALTNLCSAATRPLVSLNALENPAITLETTTKLVAALKTNKSIQKIYVSSQNGDRGELVKVLEDTLAENTFLTDIDFSFPLNDLEESSVGGIQQALLNNALKA